MPVAHPGLTPRDNSSAPASAPQSNGLASDNMAANDVNTNDAAANQPADEVARGQGQAPSGIMRSPMMTSGTVPGPAANGNAPVNGNSASGSGAPISASPGHDPVIAQAVTSVLAEDDRAARAAILSSAGINADQAVQAQQAAAATSLPVSVATRNPGQVKQLAQTQQKIGYLAGSPSLTAQMADINFATIAADDIASLSQVESGVKLIGAAAANPAPEQNGPDQIASGQTASGRDSAKAGAPVPATARPAAGFAGRFAHAPATGNDHLGEDVAAAGKNFVKGATSVVSGSLQGVAELTTNMLNPNHAEIYARIVAGDKSLVLKPDVENGQPVLRIIDQRVHGRGLVVPQTYRADSDLYQFALNMTPRQRAGALAVEMKKIDPSDNILYRAGQGLDAAAQEYLPTTAEQDAGFWTGTGPRFLGQISALAATGLVTDGAGTAALAGTLGATSNANASYHDALAKGANQLDALKAADAGGLVGVATSVVPGERQLVNAAETLAKPLARFITEKGAALATSAGVKAVTGAAQGATQQVANNAVAKSLYNPKQPLLADLGHQTLASAVANVLQSVFAHGLRSVQPATPAPNGGATDMSSSGPGPERPSVTPPDVSPPDMSATKVASPNASASSASSAEPAGARAPASSETDRPADAGSKTAVPAGLPVKPAETVQSVAAPVPAGPSDRVDTAAPSSAAKVAAGQQPSIPPARPAGEAMPATADARAMPAQPAGAVAPKAAAPIADRPPEPAAKANPDGDGASDTAAKASPQTGDQAPVLRAATGAQGVQSMLAGAAASKLRLRDQPLFANSVATMALHHGAETVQVPGDVLQTYLFHIDPAGPDLLHQMPSAQAQLPGAIAKGGPVAIPLPEFMQALAGSQTAPLLALHVKPNAEAPSLAELARQMGPQAAAGQGSSGDTSPPASDPHAGNPGAAAQAAPAAATEPAPAGIPPENTRLVFGDDVTEGDLAEAPKPAGDLKVGSAGDHLYDGIAEPRGVLRKALDGLNPGYVENGGPGINTNCELCAIAFYRRLTGQDPNAVARTTTGRTNGNAIREITGNPDRGLNLDDIEQMLLSNHRYPRIGFILVDQGNRNFHAVNYIRLRRSIIYVDPQMGKVVQLKRDLKVEVGFPQP